MMIETQHERKVFWKFQFERRLTEFSFCWIDFPFLPSHFTIPCLHKYSTNDCHLLSNMNLGQLPINYGSEFAGWRSSRKVQSQLSWEFAERIEIFNPSRRKLFQFPELPSSISGVTQLVTYSQSRNKCLSSHSVRLRHRDIKDWTNISTRSMIELIATRRQP